MAAPKPPLPADPDNTISPPPRAFLRSRLVPPPRSSIAPGCFQSHMLFQIPDTPGGLNSKLAAESSLSKALISRVPSLVIGMELCRPPRNPHGPLLAALVHSRAWPKISEYRAVSITLLPQWETIQSLCKPVTGSDGKSMDVGIMRELLDDFYKSSGNKKPEQIIIFRYGAIETQSSQILKAELDQITQACKFFYDKRSPKLVVIKFFEPDNVLPKTYYDGITCGSEIDDTANTRPSKYKIELDEVGLSASDHEELVDSLFYVHRMCIEAISYVAELYAGSRRAKIEEPKQKRAKVKIEPGDVNIQRVRDFISDGYTLALYALGHLNAEEGGKYKFERYLHRECGYFGYTEDDMKLWNHVSMYVEETNSGVVSQKIVFAELSYSNGQYESIKPVVLDPNKPAEIKYGCGICSPGFPGDDVRSPHPADKTKYSLGHWARVVGSCGRGGLIPK